MPAYFTTYPRRWEGKTMMTCNWCGKEYYPKTRLPALPGPDGKRKPSDFCSDDCEEESVTIWNCMTIFNPVLKDISYFPKPKETRR